jgi:hypothetical protein
MAVVSQIIFECDVLARDEQNQPRKILLRIAFDSGELRQFSAIGLRNVLYRESAHFQAGF